MVETPCILLTDLFTDTTSNDARTLLKLDLDKEPFKSVVIKFPVHMWSTVARSAGSPASLTA